jgi:outer membrane protein TolC
MIHKTLVRTATILGVAVLGLASNSYGQAPGAPVAPSTTKNPIPPPTTVAPSSQDFQGSVPQGTASPTPLALTLQGAITRGLRANLGLLTSEQSDAQTRAQKIQSLSRLLPDVGGSLQQTVSQINLAALGFRNAGSFNIPLVVGPFSYSTIQAQATVPIFNWSDLQNYKASKQRVRASQLSLRDARDLVVFAVGNAYLQIIASSGRVESTQAQVNTAQVLFNRATDQKRAGVIPAIDVLRAQVELQRQQQLLVVQKNQFEKDKLTLGRVIGLPVGQEFTVADPTPPVPLEALNLDETLSKAYANRSDYKAAEAQVNAAELAVKSAKAQWYPTLGASGYYGDQGPTFGNSHGVFSVTGSLDFHIFEGGRIKSDVQQRQAELNDQKNRLANLKGQIDYDVRNALLDLKASNEQVAVARSNSDLAKQTLAQAQDRFAAGVADNLEVVQAQESVATASDNLINALYSNNIAKIELVRALGLAEQGIRTYFSKNPSQPQP